MMKSVSGYLATAKPQPQGGWAIMAAGAKHKKEAQPQRERFRPAWVTASLSERALGQASSTGMHEPRTIKASPRSSLS